MNLSGNYFPYPFISSDTDDYNDKKFEINLNSAIDIKKWNFDAEIVLEDDSLKRLVKEKAAKYLISIESRSLGFRETFESFEEKFNFPILLEDVSREVNISVYLVANEKIILSSENFNRDYNGAVFHRDKGDILGRANDYKFIPEDDSDDIKDIGSIIKIVKHPKNEVGPITIGLDSENIIIYLTRKDHANYSRLLNTGNTSTLISMLVIPSLLEVLNSVQRQASQSSEPEWQDRKWYKVLIKKLISIGYSENPEDWDESHLEMIQKIIENQISIALEDIVKSYDNEDELDWI